MAMVNSCNSKPRKLLPKQILLKDYLLDDLSSCSSNGFRSFPRRQCCTSTAQFLTNNSTKNKKSLKKPKKHKSFLKRASAVLISGASKLLSSAAGKLQKNSPAPVTCLPTSLSRRLKKWKSINYFSVSNAVNDAVSERRVSNEVNGDMWVDFSNEVKLECTTGESNGTPDDDNDVVSEYKEEVRVKEGVIIAVSESSTTSSSSQNKWQNEEAKEQFSPVSVMDFPSTDEEEVSSPDEVSSPFQSRLACVEGRKKKLMQKLRMFEGLAKLKPIDLSKKFTSRTNESIESLSPTASIQDNNTNILEEIEKVREMEKNDKAINLLDQMKIISEKYKFDWENILFDFFIEGVRETNKSRNENNLVSEARDWMNGKPRELYLGWEEENNRLPYMKDMEKSGDWNIRNNRVLDEHKKEVAFELEVGVLDLIMDELVADLFDD